MSININSTVSKDKEDPKFLPVPAQKKQEKRDMERAKDEGFNQAAQLKSLVAAAKPLRHKRTQKR